jgi:hypothetical protein
MPKEFIPFVKRQNIQESITALQAIEPKVVFRVAFGPHQTYREGLALSNHIQASDLFLTELAEWNAYGVKTYNAISAGGKLPFLTRIGPQSFRKGLYEALQNTHTPVGFIDYHATDLRGSKIKKLYERKQNTAPKRRGKLIAAIGMAQDERDEYMFGHIHPVLEEFFDKNPDVAKKKQVNVLLFLGGLHTRVYHALKEANPDSTRVFSKKPYLYEPDDIEIRKALFGKTI